MTDYNAIIAEISEIQNLVLSGNSQLNQGQIIDMSSIESRVKSVCQQIQSVKGPARAQIQPQLLNLLDEMDKFYENLRSRHAELAEQIKQLNPQQKATNAYGKAMNRPTEE